MMIEKLIVGLGNPGGRYTRTRHNVGFMCVDAIAQKHNFSSSRRLFKAVVSEGTIAGKRAVLAKPQTFMNLSGEAVRSLVGWYKLSYKDLLVVYDDMDLPLGKMRIRERGSAGGHRGIQSIIGWLKTEDFPRLRVGIARPTAEEAVDYVLATFTPEEKPIVEAVIARSVDAVETILADGITVAMNRFNPDTGGGSSPQRHQERTKFD